jgi:hypothetical protein
LLPSARQAAKPGWGLTLIWPIPPRRSEGLARRVLRTMQCASAQCWYAALCIWILDLQLFKDRAESCDPLSATRTIVNSLRSNASWWRIWAILAGDQAGHRLMIPIPPLQSSLKLVAGTQTSRDPQLWDGWSKSKTRIFGGSGRIRSLRRGSMSGALVLQHLRPRTPIGESS